jgi:hypothetical protein
MAEASMSKPNRLTAAKPAKPIDIGKISKLTRMLGSNKSGEVVAAAAALGRALDAADMDFHDLADAVADGLKPSQPARASWEPSPPDLHNWESMAWFAFYSHRHLPDHDTDFVRHALLGRVGFDLGRATPELMRRLRSIVAKIKAARTAEDVW